MLLWPGAISPLLPTSSGGFPTKSGMVGAFTQVAQAIGHQGRITGHTGRVSGAQALAATGMELWRIQLFCRWGSDAVLKYVRDAALASSVTFSAEVVRGWCKQWTLDELSMAAQAKAAREGHPPDWVQAHEVEEVLEACTDRGLGAKDIISLMGRQAGALAVAEDKRLVLNARSCCVHVAVAHEVTACGWRWQEGMVTEATGVTGTVQCDKCAQICAEAFA